MSLIPCSVFVPGRTDLVWPTKLPLLILLLGQAEPTRQLRSKPFYSWGQLSNNSTTIYCLLNNWVNHQFGHQLTVDATTELTIYLTTVTYYPFNNCDYMPIICHSVYPEWPHRQGGCLACRRLQDRILAVAELHRIILCTRCSGGTAH